MDASGSIGVSNYVDAKTQLARLVGLLCPNPDPFMTFQRAALIRFSSSVDEIFDFDDNKDTADVQYGITNMEYVGAGTATHLAFTYALEMFTTAKG